MSDQIKINTGGGNIRGTNIGGNSNQVINESYNSGISREDNFVQLIESLRQQIQDLENQEVRSEALEHLEDLEIEVSSSTPKQSKLKAYLKMLWDVGKDFTLIANSVTALAERLGIKLLI